MKKWIALLLLTSGCTFKAVEDEQVVKDGHEKSKHESIDIEATESFLK